MSYSFSVTAASKADAKAGVEVEFDKVAAEQPAHASDKPAVLANSAVVIDSLTDDDTKDVMVSCSGFVNRLSASLVQGNSVCVSAVLMARAVISQPEEPAAS